MILDTLDNAALYSHLNSHFEKAFNFLKTMREKHFDTPRIEIDGTTIFALLFEGTGKNADTVKLEAHKKYIDIQYVFKGVVHQQPH